MTIIVEFPISSNVIFENHNSCSSGLRSVDNSCNALFQKVDVSMVHLKGIYLYSLVQAMYNMNN